MKSMRWSRIPNIDLKPVFPALCGAEDDAENQAKTGGAGEANKGTESTDSGDPQKKIAALVEEKDRHFNDRKAAEGKLAELEPELEELRKFRKEQEDAKLSAEEKTQQAVKELETERDAVKQENENLREAMQQLVIQQAFITAGGVKWHDPEIALSKADLSAVEIEINAKGIPVVKNPAALTKAAKALAESKAFLVDSGKQDEKPWNASGPAAPARRKGAAADDDEKAKLRRKYPTLAR